MAEDRFGPFNLRDLGGHSVEGGGTVRTETLYRGASLHRFGAACLPPVATLIDLRSPAELERDGACARIEGANVRHIPLLQRVWGPEAYDASQPLEEFLAERYLEMLEVGRDAIAEVLVILGSEENLPVILFCAAGKDRTGVVAALILSLLGVPDAAIAADYELSQEPVREFVEHLRTHGDRATHRIAPPGSPVLKAPRAAMLRFLEQLRELHGSVSDYALEIGISEPTLEAVCASLTTHDGLGRRTYPNHVCKAHDQRTQERHDV